MSGIVGIARFDGAQVDRDLIGGLTDAMAYRGPDSQQIWVDGSVGLGHALLQTAGSPEVRQPFTLNGTAWITADARIDGRAELMAALRMRVLDAERLPSDAELILRAYDAWGDDCVRHLIGDFAFAIWDGRQKRLLCARDRFGVKPFFYSQVPGGGGLVFSNTFRSVRLHPEVSGELNEQAIGDFLLFGRNLDSSSTSFSRIHRLSPAHQLVWSGGKAVVSRYWRFEQPPELKYRRPEDYVSHFKQLLRRAVDDRLRTNRVTVFMSGGLDSTTVAATAKEVLAPRHPIVKLRALTVVSERLIRCEEGRYAGLVASALGIQIDYVNIDNYRPYQPCQVTERVVQPDPGRSPFAALGVEQLRLAAAHSNVAMTGQGPDALFFYPMRPHLTALIRNRRFGRAAADLAIYFLAHRRFAFRAIFRGTKRVVQRDSNEAGVCPDWLDEEFANRLGLQQRWAELAGRAGRSGHGRTAFGEGDDGFWATLFEDHDAGSTGVPVQLCHPFFDLRLIEFCAALPPIPWCLNKYLLRTALRGMLPDAVRLRPKTPLAGDPLLEALRLDASLPFDIMSVSPRMTRYVNPNRLEPFTGKKVSDLRLRFYPHDLQDWLQHT